MSAFSDLSWDDAGLTCYGRCAGDCSITRTRTHSLSTFLASSLLLTCRPHLQTFTADLHRMRHEMLSQMAALSRALTTLILGGTLALTARSSVVLHERATKPLRLYPEHALKFSFDPTVSELIDWRR